MKPMRSSLLRKQEGSVRALAKHEGPLIIGCPEELSEAQAGALGQHKGALYLEGVQQLSASVALRLARHEGPLYLNDVRSLSLPAAEALSKHQGLLYLLEVSKVSDEVAEALVSHQGHVGIFPLAEMSDRARAALREHRRRICAEQGLSPRSELERLAGTFHPAPAGKYNEWAYICYPRLPHPDPVLLRIYWRSDWIKGPDKTLPAQLPDWFVALLPKIGECIEQLCLEPLPYGDPMAFILDVGIEITNEKLHAMYIQCVDSEALYHEIAVDVQHFPSEFHVDCWGGDHYPSADCLAYLPLNHSIFDSTLERLKWWQSNNYVRSGSRHAADSMNPQES